MTAKKWIILAGIIAIIIGGAVALVVAKPSWLPEPVQTLISKMPGGTNTTSDDVLTADDIDTINSAKTTEQWEAEKQELVGKAPSPSASVQDKVKYQTELISILYAQGNCSELAIEVDKLAALDKNTSPDYYINIVGCYASAGDSSGATTAADKAEVYIASMDDGEEKLEAEQRLAFERRLWL